MPLDSRRKSRPRFSSSGVVKLKTIRHPKQSYHEQPFRFRFVSVSQDIKTGIDRRGKTIV
jgi:hypothetical protein